MIVGQFTIWGLPTVRNWMCNRCWGGGARAQEVTKNLLGKLIWKLNRKDGPSIWPHTTGLGDFSTFEGVKQWAAMKTARATKDLESPRMFPFLCNFNHQARAPSCL